MTCGSKVQSTIGFAAKEKEQGVDLSVFSGTVGRVTIEGISNSSLTHNSRIRVGPYDAKKMPAVLTFKDKDCKTIPRRYFFDPEDGNASFYNDEDLTRQNNFLNVKDTNAVMVPPGYDLTLYEKEHWRGDHQIVTGSLNDGTSGNNDLECKSLTKSTVKSLRVSRRPQGKTVGYWRGITSSEA